MSGLLLDTQREVRAASAGHSGAADTLRALDHRESAARSETHMTWGMTSSHHLLLLYVIWSGEGSAGAAVVWQDPSLRCSSSAHISVERLDRLVSSYHKTSEQHGRSSGHRC